MSAPQTSVGFQADLFPGVIADETPHKVDTFVNAESSVELAFGRLVIAGTGQDDAKAVTSTGKPVGVVAHSHAYSKPHGDFAGELGSTGLLPGVRMNVLSSGEIYVELCENVSAGDAVRVIHTADTGQPVGTFRTSANTGNSATLSNAKFMTSGTSGGVAKLWIDALGSALTADT